MDKNFQSDRQSGGEERRAEMEVVILMMNPLVSGFNKGREGAREGKPESPTVSAHVNYLGIFESRRVIESMCLKYTFIIH